MTENDKKDIEKIISKQLKAHNTCPHGIDAETALGMKEFAQAWKRGKRTATATFIGGIVLSLMGWMFIGFIEKIKSFF